MRWLVRKYHERVSALDRQRLTYGAWVLVALAILGAVVKACS